MGIALLVSGQSLKRSVISSLGGSIGTSDYRISATFGQCPGCTVLSNSDNMLRQGFQQPFPRRPGVDEPCGFFNSFDIEQLDDQCGTSFNFEFSGTADPDDLTFYWVFGDGAYPATSYLANPQGVVYLATGRKDITMVASSGMCNDTMSVSFLVNGTGFSVDPSVTNVDCFGNDNGSVELIPFDTVGTAPFTFLWEDGTTDPKIEALPPGNYGFTVTDAEGCTFENTATVTTPDSVLVAGAIIEDQTSEGVLDGSIQLVVTGGTAPYEYNWENPDLEGDLVEDLAGDSYFVTVVDANGCSASVVHHILQAWNPEGAGDIINTVITPNGDNENEVWIVPGIEQYPNNEVEIYNRWGSMVWNTEGYMNDWYGESSDGELLPSAAYFYVVRLNDELGTVFSGAVTVIR